MNRENKLLVSLLVGLLILGLGIYATSVNLIPWRSPIYGFSYNSKVIAIGIGIVIGVISLLLWPKKLPKWLEPLLRS